MKRATILSKASEYVTKDRNTEYGEPEDAFSTIAQLWGVYLDAKPTPGRTISAYDVANMMALMKIARLAQGPSSPDSAIDLAGYAACAGEILSRRNEPRKPSVEDTTP